MTTHNPLSENGSSGGPLPPTPKGHLTVDPVLEAQLDPFIVKLASGIADGFSGGNETFEEASEPQQERYLMAAQAIINLIPAPQGGNEGASGAGSSPTEDRSTGREGHLESMLAVPPFAEGGVGWLMCNAAEAYLADYVMTTEGDDYTPSDDERYMLNDFFHGLISDEAFFGPVRALLASPTPPRNSGSPAASEASGKEGLHPDTSALVDRFAVALKAKLADAEAKYGYSNGWLSANWQADCREHLHAHVAKGDPRDVAAYAAFCWHHGWLTTAPAPTSNPIVERGEEDER